ncbi:MAG: LpxI family protein [Planctomycetaceae bacterium]|nr:MAG: LpxI family protein [Planctomycetaceae bacterium]
MIGGYHPRGSVRRVDSDLRRPIGLIAGWGRFPVLVARSLVERRIPVCCIAIPGHADEHLEYLCDHVLWSGVGRLGTHLRYFRKLGVQQVTMAGKLFKADLLYGGSPWLRHAPDLQCVRTFGPLLLSRQRNARDDSLLNAVTQMYQNHQMEVTAATDLAPDLLARPGWLVGKPRSLGLENDIRFGWEIAKQMGGLDIGQSITVKDGAVLAVEAIEGTDACICRTGEVCRRGGWVLVKVAKPRQDMRYDVPTIGPQTVRLVHEAGGVAIAIEANKTIIVDQDQTFADAAKAGIAIVAMDGSATHARQIAA